MIIGISGKIGSGKDTIGRIIQYLTLGEEFSKTNGSILADLEYDGYCADKSSFRIKKFADALKDIVCLLIGCTREQLEDREFKEKELGEEWWYYKSLHPSKGKLVQYKGNLSKATSQHWTLIKLTPRLLLQLLGTECGREILHPNIWVNALMSKYKPNVYWMCDNCMNDNIHQLIQIPNRFKDQGYTEDEYVCPTCKGKESEGDITMVLPDNYDNWIITDLRFPNELKAVKDRGGISIRINRDNGTRLIDVNPHPSETALDNVEFDYIIDNNGTIEELIEQVKEILIKEKII